MKYLAACLLFCSLSLRAFAQGEVYFDNYIPGELDAPVSRPDGTGAGAGISAQLMLVNADGTLVAIGAPTTFRTSPADAAYYINPEVVTFPGTLPGTVVVLRMVAYSGDNPSTAALTGESGNVTVTLGGGVNLPPNMDGLKGFTLQGAPATGEAAPQISSPLPTLTVSLGGPATFTVQATGNSLQYHWQHNGVDIPGANAASLNIANVQSGDAGTYKVTVSNGAGQDSSTGTLVISTPGNVDLSSTHPADNHPADFKLTADEAAAYAEAWRKGEAWLTGPNPIPAAYVSRAGALSLSGESYQVDGTVTAGPPLSWVSTANVSSTSTKSPHRGDGHPSGEGDNSDKGTPGTVQAEIRSQYVPGQSLTVRTEVTPPAGTLSYVVEEQVPAGWTVSNISQDGTFDPTNQKVKWGLFADGQERQLTYDLQAPADGTEPLKLSGVGSFDGLDVPLSGQTQSIASSQMGEPERNSHGGLDLTLEGGAGRNFAIEVSTDLVNWTQLKTFQNLRGLQHFEQSNAQQLRHQFFRAVVLP